MFLTFNPCASISILLLHLLLAEGDSFGGAWAGQTKMLELDVENSSQVGLLTTGWLARFRQLIIGGVRDHRMAWQANQGST